MDDQLCAAYLKNLALTKSSDTLRSYTHMLDAFEVFLKSYGESMATFAAEDVQEYVTSKTSWAPNTRNLFVAAVKGFAKYAKARVEMGTTLPTMQRAFASEKRLMIVLEMSRFKVPHHIQDKTLTLDELSKLLQAAHERCGQMSWKRIWLMFAMGARKGEIQNIAPENIDVDTGRVLLRTTKGKTVLTERLFFAEPKVTLPLLRSLHDTPEAHVKVKKLLDKLLKDGVEEGDANGQVWTEMKNLLPLGPLDFGGHPDTLNKTILYAKEKTDIERAVSPHWARHTFITRMREILNDDVLVKRLVGHVAGGDMTATYTSFKESDIKIATVDKHYMLSLVPMAAKWLKEDKQEGS